MKPIESLRDTEFRRLDKNGHVYLDYTGSGLYPTSLLHQQQELLETEVLGNPHSSNPTSNYSTSLIEHTRSQVLSFFNADPLKYTAIFTANATGAIKLVGESFPFNRASSLSLLADNHNSVNGLREYANAKRSTVTYIPLDSRLRAKNVDAYLRRHYTHAANLFAYPAQSNFSGVKHPFSYIRAAHRHGWFVLLDAAAYAPTSRLDLSTIKPDFVCISFYKMFGLPTGVGVLIARRKALVALQRPWFAGGTVKFASVGERAHSLADGESAFEDGTLNFLSIPTVAFGLQFLQRVGMDRITAHVDRLGSKLLRELGALRYGNGLSMVRIYGPTKMEDRGGCFTFDVLSRHGTRVDARLVEKAANKQRISLRVGCFCNPGAAEYAIPRDTVRARECIATLDDVSMEALSECVGEFLGAVRCSLGIASNDEDVEALVEFVEGFCTHLTNRSEWVGKHRGRHRHRSVPSSPIDD